MDERIRLAVEIEALLEELVSVHNDIFAPPLWRTIRRSIPIPIVFEAIEFRRHADKLAVVRRGLEMRRSNLIDISQRDSDSKTSSRFLIDLEHFIVSLEATVTQLFRLCNDMARDRHGRPDWSEYKQRIDEYETLRRAQMSAGFEVQSSFADFKREA